MLLGSELSPSHASIQAAAGRRRRRQTAAGRGSLRAGLPGCVWGAARWSRALPPAGGSRSSCGPLYRWPPGWGSTPSPWVVSCWSVPWRHRPSSSRRGTSCSAWTTCRVTNPPPLLVLLTFSFSCASLLLAKQPSYVIRHLNAWSLVATSRCGRFA